MSTEAGKRLIGHWASHSGPVVPTIDRVSALIAAIEAEAIAAERERIVAQLRAQLTPPRLFAMSAWDIDCVLAIIRGEQP